MNEINKFIKLVSIEESNNIAIDFDGVIHKNDKGFHDGTIYGKPLKNAIDNIKRLSENYNIIIFTCKANPDRPLVDGKTGIELIWNWLEKYEIKECVSKITSIKPRVKFYIDDKNIEFTDWSSFNKNKKL